MKKIRYSVKQDRISYLPDSIQTHILSFLPLEDAILTSLLSTQWRHSCSSLSRLRFTQNTVEERKRGKMVEFVDRVLSCHDESRIDSFNLTVRVDNETITSDHIERWVSFAVSHRVQMFWLWDLSSPVRFNALLPFPIFTCSTLTRVSLRNIKLRFTKIDTICFPLLESLHLQDAKLSPNKFFSAPNCPSLLILVIKRCKFQRLYISLPSLEKLAIIDSNRNPNIYLSNPSLRNLVFCSEGAPRYISTKTISSALHVRFCLSKRRPSSLEKRRLWSLAKKLQNGLHNVEKLVISRFYIEYLMKNPRYLIDFPAAPFSSMKRLKFSYSSKNQVQAIKLLLRNFPKLKTLSMKCEEQPSMSDVDNTNGSLQSNETQLTVSDTMFKYLKIVELQRFKGRESELELSRWLLQNACTLEKLKICYPGHEEVSEVIQATIEEKLLSFPRTSPSVVISIYEVVE